MRKRIYETNFDKISMNFGAPKLLFHQFFDNLKAVLHFFESTSASEEEDPDQSRVPPVGIECHHWTCRVIPSHLLFGNENEKC